jgi:hypothetical protein
MRLVDHGCWFKMTKAAWVSTGHMLSLQPSLAFAKFLVDMSCAVTAQGCMQRRQMISLPVPVAAAVAAAGGACRHQACGAVHSHSHGQGL